MKKIIVVLCFLTSFSLFGQAPEFEWVNQIGGSSLDEGNMIATDDLGNVYVTGKFSGTADFDPGPGVYNLTPLGGGGAYISKFSPNGELLWAYPLGGFLGSAIGYGLAIDPMGDICVIGTYSGTVDFDPGPGTYYLSEGYIFMMKVDSNGSFIWAKDMGGAFYSGQYHIAFDSNGNIYTTGFFYGTYDFDPGPGVFNLTAEANNDGFILKLNPQGDFVWVKHIAGTSGISGTAIATDDSDNVYSAGGFRGTIDFDFGPDTFALTGTGTSGDVYLLKLNADGDFIWAKSIKGPYSEGINDLTLDEVGNIYAVGNFVGTEVDFDPGPGEAFLDAVGGNDTFISKFDTHGNYIWAKAISGSESEYGNTIALDGNNNVLVAGEFNGNVDFDPGSEVYFINGFYDLFIAKLDNDGNFIWAGGFTGGSYDFGTPMAVDIFDNIYTTGAFQYSLDFDPSQNDFTLNSTGGTDIFIHKLRQQPCNASPTINSTNTSFGICAGESITLTANMPDWIQNFSFIWNTGDTADSIVVSPDSTTNYSVSVTYTSGSITCNSSFATDVIVVPGIEEIPYNGLDDDCDPTTLDDDLDGDGLTFLQDCDDNDPSIPAVIGSSCDDGNPYNFNDIIQGDQCTCAGTGNDIPIFEWAFQQGGGSTDSGRAITEDSEGNIIVTGVFRGTSDFDPSTSSTSLTALGYGDVFVTKHSPEGDLLWVVSAGGEGYDIGYGITTDDLGNVYITGEFEGTVDFAPGASTFNLTSYNEEDPDIFIWKLDADGNFIWAQKIGGEGADTGQAIALDDLGNVYTTGAYRDTTDFDPGPGVFMLNGDNSRNAFISKLNNDGDFLWAKSMEGEESIQGNSITIDDDNNVYTIGYFEDSITIDPAGVGLNMSSLGRSDIFVLKFNDNGDLLWTENFGVHNEFASANAITNDEQGNIYLTGYFAGSVDFDSGFGQSFLTSIGNRGVFTLKLDSNGDFAWVTPLSMANTEEGYGISLDENNNVYTTGYFSPGTARMFIQKLSNNGSVLWLGSMNGQASDRSQGIVLGKYDNIYTTGSFQSITDFDPGDGVFQLSANWTDIFIHKMRQSCNARPTIVSSNSTSPLLNTSSFSICHGDSITLSASMPDWIINESYYWNTSDTTDTILLVPDSTISYTLTVQYTAESSTCVDTTVIEVTVSSGQEEIPYNGIDDDCDETTLDDDLDQDGFSFDQDCDDNDPGIPASQGTACDDGNPETSNDVIQMDGCSCIGSYNIDPPILEWVIEGGGDYYDLAYDIINDSLGNVIITGSFTNAIDFDPGPDEYILDATGGGSDAFVSKYDKDGTLLWAFSLEGEGSRGQKLALDSLGNIYITGYFYGLVDFDPGPENYDLNNIYDRNIFVLKLDEEGGFIWAKSMGSTERDEGKDIVVDHFGNSYITGYFQETADFDPGPSTYNLTSNGEEDCFILKLNVNGDFEWAKAIGSEEDDGQSFSLAIDSLNNLYTTGTFREVLNFEPSSSQYNLTAIGYIDMFVLKLDSDGNVVWVKQMGGDFARTSPEDIVLDQEGNIYTTGGFFNGVVDFDPGIGVQNLLAFDVDVFLCKLDINGNYLWAKSIPCDDWGRGKALTLDENNNVYTTGVFRGTADFDPSIGVFNLSSGDPDDMDIFILKTDANGLLLWAGSFEGASGAGYSNYEYSIVVDQWSNIYTSGGFSNLVDFDPGPEVYELDAPGNNYDFFINKLRQNPCYSSPTIISTIPFGVCLQDSITLGVELPAWVSNATYTWSTGAVSDSITIAPSTDMMYTVSVSYSANGSSCNGTDSVLVSILGSTAEIPYNGLDDDCDETTLDDDLDQDGFNFDEDCDDNNPLVNSGQVEIPYNGIDDDCDEATLDDDLDQDGFLLANDCDDNNSSIPRMPGSICNDGNPETFQDQIQSDSCSCVGENFVNPPVLEWALNHGGSGYFYSSASSLTTDRWGNVYTAGTFYSTVDFDPGPESLNLTAVGETDIFITKYDANGKMLWAYSFGDTDFDGAHDITTDTFGNVYITGGFKGTIDFDPGPETNYLTSTGEHDMFTLKIDKTGILVWAKNMSNYTYSGYRPTSSIAVDDFGNVYTTGFFQGIADFDPGPDVVSRTANGNWIDIYILKLNSEGEFVWAKTFEGEGFDSGLSIAIDSFNNVYTTGYFDNTIDFDPGPDVFYLTDDNIGKDVFILKLNTNGAFIWAKKLASSSNCRGRDIAVDEAGNVHVTGYFFGVMDFDPGPGAITHSGYGDIFIVKLDANGNYVWSKVLEAYFSSIATDEARAKSIALDKNNNVYVLTTYDAFNDLDPGPYIYQNPVPYSEGVLVLKLAANGEFVWAGVLPGTGLIEWNGSIHIDDWDNIYTTGNFGGTVDFDMGIDTFNLTANYRDVFVQKLRQNPCNAIPSICSTGTSMDNCIADSIVTLSAEMPSWASNFTYSWNTGETTDSIIVVPDSTMTYTVSANYVIDTFVCSNTASFEVEAFSISEEIPYNGLDDDCNPNTPDDDLDGDGFLSADDCDDNNFSVNQDGTEIPYNGLDDDCDETTPDDDLDGDGLILAEDCDDTDPLIGSVEIPYNGLDDDCNPETPDDDLDGDGVPLIGDCDDTNPEVNYNMEEIPYNGLDDDCNFLTLDDDLDQDGFGIAEDCDDNNALVNPDVTEIPYNGLDDDCDPTTLDDDLDQDGFVNAEDCDDNNPLVNTGEEIPYNGLDDDCDELTLDDDLDQDGFGIAEDCDDENPLVNIGEEIPYNGLDDDCDETTLDDDLDQDGFGIGEDCDDENPLINSEAEEIANNGIDEDCDGEDLMVSTKELLTIKPQIFPNPTNGHITILLPRATTANLQIKDYNGRTLAQQELIQEQEIDLGYLTAGVYVLVIKMEEDVFVERLVLFNK